MSRGHRDPIDHISVPLFGARLMCVKVVAAVVVGAMVLGACGDSDPARSQPTTNPTDPSTTPPTTPPTDPLDLRLVEEIDVPLREASGVARTGAEDGWKVSVIGDRSYELATTSYSPTEGFGSWRMSDLGESDRWGMDDGDSQFEAAAYGGPSLLAVVQEDPPLVTIGDPDATGPSGRVRLLPPDPSQLPWDDAGSGGEGIALLSSGRLLIAKEKDPPALVMYAPSGDVGARLAKPDLLPEGEVWEAPEGDNDYVPVAAWRLDEEAAGLMKDLSALAIGPDSSLWLLSDESERLAEVALDDPLGPGGEVGLERVFQLPELEGKPEGVAHLGQDRFLIVLDRESKKSNGGVVEIPD